MIWTTGVQFLAGKGGFIFSIVTRGRRRRLPTVYRGLFPLEQSVHALKLTSQPPSVAEFRNVWSFTAIYLYAFMAWYIIAQ
jgi:hypothetical protein